MFFSGFLDCSGRAGAPQRRHNMSVHDMICHYYILYIIIITIIIIIIIIIMYYYLLFIIIIIIINYILLLSYHIPSELLETILAPYF